MNGQMERRMNTWAHAPQIADCNKEIWGGCGVYLHQWGVAWVNLSDLHSSHMWERCSCSACPYLQWCEPPTQRRCVSSVYGALQTLNSSLGSTICHYRQHGEAELTWGQHQSQYPKTGNAHVCTGQTTKSYTHLHAHTNTHRQQANSCCPLLKWPGPSSDTSHN